MKKELERRLDDLERRLTPAEIPPVIFVLHPVSEEQRQNLAPGQRLVLDGYRHSGLLISAAERTTSDPEDHGRRCEPEGYLEDVIRRIHQDCSYRNSSGVCHCCEGTPIANT